MSPIARITASRCSTATASTKHSGTTCTALQASSWRAARRHRASSSARSGPTWRSISTFRIAVRGVVTIRRKGTVWRVSAIPMRGSRPASSSRRLVSLSLPAATSMSARYRSPIGGAGSEPAASRSRPASGASRNWSRSPDEPPAALIASVAKQSRSSHCTEIASSPAAPRNDDLDWEWETMPENPRWKHLPPGSTWGDWGPDDQLGRLNLLTSEKVLKGIAEVREGKTFCLSLPLDYPGGTVVSPRRHPPRLIANKRNGMPYIAYPLAREDPKLIDVVCDDIVEMTLQYSKQLDSLAHVGQLFDADGDGRPEIVFY